MRRTRNLILACLLLAPALAAAPGLAHHEGGPIAGHTVHALLPVEQGASVTVPVVGGQFQAPVLGGVLWHNDQHLLGGPARAGDAAPPLAAVTVLVREHAASAEGDSAVRRPCGGAVLAVNAGDPDPTRLAAAVDADDPERVLQDDGADRLTYVDSVYFVDPNDVAWIVDTYRATVAVDRDGVSTVAPGGDGAAALREYPVWVANVHPAWGGPWAFMADAVGQDCEPVRDVPAAGFVEPTDPVLNGGASYCYNGLATPPESCGAQPPRTYNAVLLLPFGDGGVRVEGTRFHDAATLDTNGCADAPVAPAWPCPLDDVELQGNSHPFHPLADREDTFAHWEVHVTGAVDVYWSPDTRPPEPDERVFTHVSLDGSRGPFHDHA